MTRITSGAVSWVPLRPLPQAGRPARPAVRAGDGERGAALLLVLVVSAMATAIAAVLLVSIATDTLIAGSYRASQETFYALEAGLERSIGELAVLPNWSVVLASPPANRTASFDDGSAAMLAPDGRALRAAALTTVRQSVSNADAGPAIFGADSPLWRLYAHASLQAVLPADLIAPPAYVLVWVADDGGDGDGDPSSDANGQLLLHAEAYGVSGARRGVDVAIGRAGPGGVRLLSWKDMR